MGVRRSWKAPQTCFMYYSNITRTYSAQMIQGWPISIQSRLLCSEEPATPIIILWTSESQWTCCLQFVRIWCFCLWQLPANAPGVCSDLSQTCHICLFVPCWHVMCAGQPGTWHWVTAPVTHHTLSRDAGHWSILWRGSKFRNRNWCELIGFPCWVLRCKYRELWMFEAR